MDYRKAYEELSRALWEYDKTHNDAYVRLMLAMRAIEERIGEPVSPITLAEKRKQDQEK